MPYAPPSISYRRYAKNDRSGWEMRILSAVKTIVVPIAGLIAIYAVKLLIIGGRRGIDMLLGLGIILFVLVITAVVMHRSEH